MRLSVFPESGKQGKINSLTTCKQREEKNSVFHQRDSEVIVRIIIIIFVVFIW